MALAPVLPGGILRARCRPGHRVGQTPKSLSKVLAHPRQGPPDTPWSQLIWDGQSHVSQMDSLGHTCGPAWLGGDNRPHRKMRGLIGSVTWSCAVWGKLHSLSVLLFLAL